MEAGKQGANGDGNEKGFVTLLSNGMVAAVFYREECGGVSRESTASRRFHFCAAGDRQEVEQPYLDTRRRRVAKCRKFCQKAHWRWGANVEAVYYAVLEH